MSTTSPSSVPSSAPAGARLVDGRIIFDELPVRIALLPGEVDIVNQYLRGIVDALFGSDVEGY